MPPTINSFDVFDTLIARRGFEPRSVLDKLEARTRLPNLAAARTAADRNLWALEKPYSLADIWRETHRLLGLAGPSADRLMEMEIELEHEEVIPIADNLALVKDGDLLISD